MEIIERIHAVIQRGEIGTQGRGVGARLGGAFRREQGVKHFQERRQLHTGLMKQEKVDVMQHLEALWL
ncbi:hypothetical protein T07_2398 [Trichinella nelsoni]|uniref:Uncharacterized protein n=1 Tax=Trichinella nelsoni TaxID=6336 RepID=A0A0V0RDD4_9BILA|nr:hypothetical protein T07_2398 [Trichinella nelsoni]